jgi:integrase/recombinase XerD
VFELVELYLRFKALSCKPKTVLRLNSYLMGLARYLEKLGFLNFGEVRSEHLIRYSSLRSQKLSILSHYFEIQIINGFFVWLVCEEYLLTSVYLPKRKKPSYKVVKVKSQGEVNEVLRQSERGKFSLRNRAMAELIYSCGLRRSELVGLDMNDVLGDKIKVLGKGDKERILYLGESVKRYLRAYVLGERFKVLERAERRCEALFLGEKGVRLSLSGVGDVFRRQLNLGITAHGFRHACASHLLENGCSIRIIQEFLGHSRVRTTEIYTQVNDVSLGGMLENFHPRG